MCAHPMTSHEVEDATGDIDRDRERLRFFFLIIIQVLKHNGIQSLIDDLAHLTRRHSQNMNAPVNIARQCNRALHKLAHQTDTFPKDMALSGVTRAVDTEGELLDAIHSGGYGDIYLGQLDGRAVAIKRPRPTEKENEVKKAFFNEALLIWEVRHPYIIPLLGVSRSVKGLSTSLCLIFPWYSNGTVDTALSTSASKDRLEVWVLQLVDAVAHLHSRAVPLIHGDIRPSNVLIDDHLNIRLADFGLARFSDTTDSMSASSGSGFFKYQAPEIALALASLFYKSTATDVWGIGCTIYEMYDPKGAYHQFNKPYPLYEAMKKHVPPALSRPQSPHSRSTMPEALWEILCSACWAFDPAQRQSLLEIQTRVAVVLLTSSTGMEKSS